MIRSRLLRYGLVGIVGTAVQYAVLWMLVESRATGAVLASTIGAVCGAVVNYLLNYRLTFESTRSHRSAATRFGTVALAGLGLNGISMSLLVDRLSMQYLLAQGVTTLGVFGVTFVLNKRWSFHE